MIRSNHSRLKAQREFSHKRALLSYSIGFLSSIVLTLAAYFMVVSQLYSAWTVAYIVSSLAIVQFIVQLMFFLHLGKDTKIRWKFISFLFMLVIVLIVVVGSLWIMHNLNYRMMPTDQEVDTYMSDQQGI